MSKNALVIPTNLNLPAELLEQYAGFTSQDDLDAGVSAGFPHISIRGAKWRVVAGGEEFPVYLPDTKDLSPFLKVVILRANPNVSKTFYEGQYVEGSDDKPSCYSNDGIKPGADSPNPQSSACATCPQNAWGSRISPSGAKIKACADVRRIAVIPADDMTFSPLLLRVPAASLGDLAGYGRALKQRGIPYAAVVTKLSFDSDAAYPKIQFQFERVLTQEEMHTAVEQMQDPSVEDILGLTPPRDAAPALPDESDKFGIPADIAAPTETAEATNEQDQLQEATQNETQAEPETAAPTATKTVARKPAAKKAAAKTAAKPVVEEAVQETAGAPVAASDTSSMMSDLEAALAGLNM